MDLSACFAERFRTIRPSLQIGACWGTSEQARSSRNRGAGSDDECLWQAQICDRRDLSTGAEVIVSAISNDGQKRSSDPHEWRNDLSAVSTRGSAKLNWP